MRTGKVTLSLIGRLSDPYLDALPEDASAPAWLNLGPLDAPEVMPAGSHMNERNSTVGRMYYDHSFQTTVKR